MLDPDKSVKNLFYVRDSMLKNQVCYPNGNPVVEKKSDTKIGYEIEIDLPHKIKNEKDNWLNRFHNASMLYAQYQGNYPTVLYAGDKDSQSNGNIYGEMIDYFAK